MKLWKKYRELIIYLVVGVATTAVNLTVYFALTRYLGVYYMAAQAAAWLCAVVFAYAANKTFVFRDKRSEPLYIVRQFAEFAGMRLVTGLVESALLYILVEYADLSDDVTKIAVAFIVVVGNYIISKLLIFRR